MHFKLKFTSGHATLSGNEFLIVHSTDNLIRLSEGSGANQMTDAVYSNIDGGETVEIVPPGSFG